MQGTDSRGSKLCAADTKHELIAAGGITTMEDVRALSALGVHCAIGMSIYKGHLRLDELAEFNATLAASGVRAGTVA